VGIVKQFNRKENERINKALRCMNDRICDEKFDLLQVLSPQVLCNGRKSKLSNNSLDDAKDVLKSHLDFIILEKMGENATINAMSRVFLEDPMVMSELMNEYYNVGFLNTHRNGQQSHHKNQNDQADNSRTYRKLMPESVVDYLTKENSLDIEFYEYAVKLFEERALEEHWHTLEK
jgi:hypothetical protein